ncbi:MAG: hypothetical protein V1822_01000 [Candidatus Micrarchaeota archaeon]
MGFSGWISGGKKSSHDELRKSEDFRKSKTGPEPKIPFLTSLFAFPYIGAIRGYYLLLALFFVLFIATKSPLVGFCAGATIAFIVVWEFYAGSKSGGVANEIRDTAIAIGLGLLVWFGSGYVLNTPTPINAIVSCSMLPAYERGDMIILQGAMPNTQYVDYPEPVSSIPMQAWVKYNGGDYSFNGSLYSYCQAHIGEQICMDFLREPASFEESHGPLVLKYGQCIKQGINTKEKKYVPCVRETYFGAKKIEFSKDADLIVYAPKNTDVYSLVGDIIHRARFAINASDGIIYFTKGDNNPVYDFQIYSSGYKMGNSPVSPEQIKGRGILRIPLLGNFKLFISPQVLFLDDDSTGCNAYFVG